MFKKYFLPVLFFFFLVFNFSCSSPRRTIAVEDGWELLGELTANFGRDNDVLQVNSSTKYTALRFKVEKREIKIRGLEVVYANLDKLSPVFDEVLAADQYSKIVDLGSEGKEIRAIEFKYRTTGNILKGRAKILAFGKRY